MLVHPAPLPSSTSTNGDVMKTTKMLKAYASTNVMRILEFFVKSSIFSRKYVLIDILKDRKLPSEIIPVPSPRTNFPYNFPMNYGSEMSCTDTNQLPGWKKMLAHRPLEMTLNTQDISWSPRIQHAQRRVRRTAGAGRENNGARESMIEHRGEEEHGREKIMEHGGERRAVRGSWRQQDTERRG